jgi:hypothetical protein
VGTQAKAGGSVDLLLGKLAPLGFCQPNGCPLDLQAARPRLPPTMVGGDRRIVSM